MAPNIFGMLPQVNKCCFCFELKTGCFIIGGVYLLFILEAFAGRSASKELQRCYHLDPFMQVLGCMALVVCVTTFIFTLIFLYGITKSVPSTALYFMYTTILLLIFNVIVSTVMMFAGHKNCSKPYLFGGASFLGALLLIYFLIVVNSYHRILTARVPVVREEPVVPVVST